MAQGLEHDRALKRIREGPARQLIVQGTKLQEDLTFIKNIAEMNCAYQFSMWLKWLLWYPSRNQKSEKTQGYAWIIIMVPKLPSKEGAFG